MPVRMALLADSTVITITGIDIMLVNDATVVEIIIDETTVIHIIF